MTQIAKAKMQLVESQIELIIERLISAGLIQDDDDVTTKIANVLQGVLEEW